MPKVKKQRQTSSKVLHPHSRKASQLRKKTHRMERVELHKLEHKKVMSHKVSKLLWFRERIDESKTHYSMHEMVELIELHLHRLDQELAAIATVNSLPNRHGRQYSSREDALVATVAKERELFEGAGFEAPDLLEPKTFEAFRKWNGEEHLLANVPLRRYKPLTQGAGSHGDSGDTTSTVVTSHS